MITILIMLLVILLISAYFKRRLDKVESRLGWIRPHQDLKFSLQVKLSGPLKIWRIVEKSRDELSAMFRAFELGLNNYRVYSDTKRKVVYTMTTPPKNICSRDEHKKNGGHITFHSIPTSVYTIDCPKCGFVGKESTTLKTAKKNFRSNIGTKKGINPALGYSVLEG